MNRFVRFEKPTAIAGGICASIGYLVGLPAWFVRLMTIVITLGTSMIVLGIYIVVWFLAPSEEAPADYDTRPNLFRRIIKWAWSNRRVR